MTNVDMLRRTFLLQTTALTASAAFASSPASTLLAMPQGKSEKPYDVDRKFYADGKARPFAGNTIISQIPLRTPANDALTLVRNTLATHEFSQCLSLLPPSSYHMTVFEGVIDEQRKAPFWPAEVPGDAQVQVCTHYFTERLKNFALEENFRLQMRFDEFNVYRDSGATLRLVPANLQERNKLRDLRDRLAQCLGIRSPDHDNYGFHITLGYLVRWMTPEQTRDYASIQRECLGYLRQTFDSIELDAPRFCTFNDMLAFDDKFAIGQRPHCLTRLPRSQDHTSISGVITETP
ncbi:DUF1868 domain-containing protein [Pseudomonas cannabina]|uniref:DUF1868 domain-containing protein n=2 Tax=Pseudomonas syringae group TaxID=136849 RepID=A0A8T8BWL8_PSEYM|nr:MULTISPECIES: DUF1868 domain-containing protein [Pseudomonas syringae group]KPB72040.1 Uncharacterized protein AC507_3902 [Pseudomonas syringae pv. maculicola]KPW26067.1 hypothetical protein ALO83_102322 [Pseudomonas cannabina pv. alisalensis]QHE95842.1 DUF1868 domain-containing protein [Pseudomonas syringae pv. maculicola str. ES4326]QQN22863.1 DUF1868 domain-containing protein [Pseudomonas cannabina pv. alisalensis]RMN88359.1 hypothetical protein ALQ52_102818 [Pseudomonas cannabina pv. al